MQHGETLVNNVKTERIMDPASEAVAAYHSGMNSAQSIYCGFRVLLEVPEHRINAAGRLGRGRAIDGRCGALYAAMDLARHFETKGELQSIFEEVAGSQHCREIRSKQKLSCTGCVELAAFVLAKQEHAGSLKSR